MKKNYLYAMLSLFVVGLGQIVKGDAEKGIKYILLFYFVLPVLVYFSLTVSGAAFLVFFGVALIFAIIFWIYNVIDAYSCNPGGRE